MITYKVVMIGDFGVGKTSLVKRFVDNSFNEDYLSTIGVSISKKSLISQETKLKTTMMLWDIEGRTAQKPILKKYLIGAKAFVIVADLSRTVTINSIQTHIQLCESIANDIPIVIALNKSDLETKSSSAFENIQTLSKNIINVYKTSAKSGDVVDEIFNDINKAIVSKV